TAERRRGHRVPRNLPGHTRDARPRWKTPTGARRADARPRAFSAEPKAATPPRSRRLPSRPPTRLTSWLKNSTSTDHAGPGGPPLQAFHVGTKTSCTFSFGCGAGRAVAAEVFDRTRRGGRSHGLAIRALNWITNGASSGPPFFRKRLAEHRPAALGLL